MPTPDDVVPELRLPRRYEILRARASEKGIDPTEFVERVDDAAARVDDLLGHVRTSDCGQFELIFGASGSGKTTFVSTLPKFFSGVEVHVFQGDRGLAELPDFVRQTAAGSSGIRVILVNDRDNPSEDDVGDARAMFDALRRVFRTPDGRALVLWPITDEPVAESLSSTAWNVGSDSLVDVGSQGLFQFGGLPKGRFFDVADVTTRNLTGDGLEVYGIQRTTAEALLHKSQTITQFYYYLEQSASATRDQTWSVLKERVRPKVWVVLPGDRNTDLDATVASLTQGTQSRIDVDLLGEFIDGDEKAANYLADWRERRHKLAHLIRALDVRLFSLPPNVALAAVRAFGDDEIKKPLKQGSTSQQTAIETMQRSRLYKALALEAGQTPAPFRSKTVGSETEDEYRRVQALASKSDKLLNKAVAKLIEATLSVDGITAKVVPEKSELPGSSLKPDIQVVLDEDAYICIEPTWRSTATGVAGEIPKGQNTLAPGHIKKYLLEKVTDYVKDLGL